MDEIFSFNFTSSVEIRMGDCLDLIEDQENIYDAIVTDPPYEISYHEKNWDQTGISFSSVLWRKLFKVLKPGGFIAAFAAMRLYHRLATAAEDVGFSLYPFMTWKFDGGLPKPINVSELFDRDNIAHREIIGFKNGSGYTKANVDHGAQNRSTTKFPIYARHASQEAQDWRGHYYGVNALKPCMEPIMIAQKPVATKRVIDNIRAHGTGSLNLGALQDRHGSWPTTILEHKKAKKSDHGSNHVSVKPIGLMEDLCLLVCPANGKILDPFAGTGSTGVAARKTGFDCVLIEKDETMETVLNRRIKLLFA